MRIVAEYVYKSATASLLAKKWRLAGTGKGFCWFRYDASSDLWRMSDHDVAVSTLYRLEVLAQSEPGLVHTAEGEKDVDRLIDLGLVAVCSGGAGSWKRHHSEQLKQHGCVMCVVFRDNDPAGLRHAHDTARENLAVGIPTKLVELPGLGPGQDVSDYLDAGGTLDDLLTLIKSTKLVTAGDLLTETPRKPTHRGPYKPIDPRLRAVYQERLKFPATWTGSHHLSCPFHPDGATPSLHLDLDKLLWHCFGCGLGGGPLDFYIAWKKIHEGVTLTRRAAEFRMGCTYL